MSSQKVHVQKGLKTLGVLPEIVDPDTGFDPCFAKHTENICTVKQNYVANWIKMILTAFVGS